MTKKDIANIAIWGRIPPPIGGMAVHVQRLLPYLKKYGITVQMYSFGRATPYHISVKQVADRRLRKLVELIFCRSEPLHYVLSDATSARFAASFLSYIGKSKVIIRVGGNSLEKAATSSNFFERIFIRFAIRNATAVIGVNKKICNLAKSLGAQRVYCIPGFIASDFEDKSLPLEVNNFINQSSGPFALASGEVQPQKYDLYGAYELLDALNYIPNLKIIFYAYLITADRMQQEILRKEIEKRNLQHRFCLFCSESELVPAMQKCDLLIRPTRSDGDSNAIREALYHNLPVVASNCVDRPDGVVTYNIHDKEDFVATILQVICNLQAEKEKLRSLPKKDYALEVVKLFNELL